MMREAGGAPGIFYWLPHSIRAPTISARRFRSPYALPRQPRPLHAAYLVLLLDITHLEQTASLAFRKKGEEGIPGILRKTVRKRSFSVTTLLNTERLAERETSLYSLGSELNRTV